MRDTETPRVPDPHTLAESRPLPPHGWEGNAHARMLGNDTETHLMLPGTIGAPPRLLTRTGIASIMVALMGVVALWGAWIDIARQDVMNKVQTNVTTQTVKRDELEAIGTDEVCDIGEARFERDKVGRYVVHVDIKNNADTAYDAYLTCDVTLRGGGAEDEWSGTVSHIGCDCLSEDTYMEKTYVVASALQSGETRTLTLYPDFSEGVSAPTKITEVTAVSVSGWKAWPTETILPTTDDVKCVSNLSESASIMTITAKTEKSETRLPALKVEVALLDVHNDPIGAKYADGIDFPFGIVTVSGTMPAHGIGTEGYVRIDTDTAGVARRTLVTSIHK